MDTTPAPFDFTRGITWFGMLQILEPLKPTPQVIYDVMYVDKPGRFALGVTPNARLAVWLQDGAGTHFQVSGPSIEERLSKAMMVIVSLSAPNATNGAHTVRVSINNTPPRLRQVKNFYPLGLGIARSRMGTALVGGFATHFSLAEMGVLTTVPDQVALKRLWDYAEQKYSLSGEP